MNFSQSDPEAVWKEFVEQVVEVASVPDEKVNKDATLEDLDMDSLDMVEATMALEEAFDISIDESELEELKTMGDLFELVLSKLPK